MKDLHRIGIISFGEDSVGIAFLLKDLINLRSFVPRKPRPPLEHGFEGMTTIKNYRFLMPSRMDLAAAFNTPASQSKY